MGNDRLRAALQTAGLGPDDLANIVEVDVRTVRRWLSGGTPYPRQQGKVARALDVAEHDLWPPTAPDQAHPPADSDSDVAASYTAASDLAAPDRAALMRDATSRIDLLGDTLEETVATGHIAELLAAKAAEGCAVRVLIYDTDEHFAPLSNRAGIEIRLLHDPAGYLIHRYDDNLLLTLHLIGGDPDRSPFIHLRHVAAGGLFDRLANYYNELWTNGSDPLSPGIEAAGDKHDNRDNPHNDARLPGPDRPQAATGEPAPPPAPRRWPGRKDRPRTYR